MMTPPRLIDISYKALFYAFASCLRRMRAEQALQAQIADLWKRSSFPNVLCTLSVRSAFALLLEALRLPKGSEVLMTGVTIPDMWRIAEQYGVKVVPIDITMRDLSIRVDTLSQHLSPKTKMIVVAHLYGAVTNLNPLIQCLDKYPDILLVEDCAQAFSGLNGYLGHPKSHVCLYSFGMIKTATAIGGAVACIKDAALYARMLKIHQTWPSQSTWRYFKKINKALGLKLISSPLLLRWFLHTCQFLEFKPEDIVLSLFRGFPQANILPQICVKPSRALLYMLDYRLRRFDDLSFGRRIASFQFLCEQLAPSVSLHGRDNPTHTNWMCTVTPKAPTALINGLRDVGVFCLLGSPQLKAISRNDDAPGDVLECSVAMKQAVYVPITAGMTEETLKAVAKVMNKYA